MARYKLTLEYDGTGLIGWQKNRHGDSVQSLLHAAIYKFCQQDVDVVGAGRTDAGVHALSMCAHIDIEQRAESREQIKKAINFHLKEMDARIVILDCELVSDDFHARFDCKMRHYKYVILNRTARPVLEKDKVYWIPKNLDVNKMIAVAPAFLGERDWTSFRAAECQAKSPIKSLESIQITNHESRITIEVSGRSFLHHQVRNIVGTLVEIGLGKDLNIDEIFAARNRAAAGPTAPASGLYFVAADY